MDFREALERVEASAAFKDYKAATPDAVFVHVFRMYGQGDEGWQFGYYSPRAAKIVVFTATPIRQLPPDDVFSQTQPQALDRSKVRVEPDEAVALAKQRLTEQYGCETATQVILILQQLEDPEPVYNLTLVTNTFHLVNYKFSAQTKELLREERHSLLSLGEAVKK